MYKICLKDEGYKLKYGVEPAYGLDYDIKSINLIVAKNDVASFQVIISSDSDGTLSLGDTPMFSYYGKTNNLRASVECELETNISPIEYVDDDFGQLRSDIILDKTNVHILKNKPVALWVETTIPKSAKSGIYSGKIKFYSHFHFDDEEQLCEFEFKIDVKDVTLPDPCDYRFHLDLWQHPCNIARKHEVEYWSDEHFVILKRYLKTLGDLGQKDVTIIASEIPWSGQRCYNVPGYLSDLYEYNIIQVYKRKDGRFEYDYSNMQKYIDTAAECGINQTIAVFGLANIWVYTPDDKNISDYPDDIRIRYYDETDNTYKYMRKTSEILNYISSLEEYFVKTEQIDRVLVVADEPGDIDKYRVCIDLLKKAAPKFKYKTAINHAEFVCEFEDEISDMAPSLECYAANFDFLRNFKSKHEGNILWYVCCAPQSPNTFITSPLAESRFIPIFTYFMGLDGFLRWNYAVWPENPREKLSYRSPNWKSGDTNFVYPSFGGFPLLSLRYKILKRGITDYELIRMVEDKFGKTDEIFDKIKSIFLKTDDFSLFTGNNINFEGGTDNLFSKDYNDYENIKELLLTRLAEEK